MRFSEAKGRKVVSASNAETVAKVDEFLIDPKTRAVLAIKLKKSSAGDTLLWTEITGFGADAVIVAGVESLKEAPARVDRLEGKDRRVLGKRVLSTGGDVLGEVKDVEFDAESGAVTALILADGDLAGARLVGIGSYAVVVKAET